jgi:hypothetical protein
MSTAYQTYKYWMPESGALLSRTEGGAPLYLDIEQLLAVVRANTYGIPVGWFVGMAEREIGGRNVGGPFKWNEVAADFNEDGSSKGGDTYGLFQVRKSAFAASLSLGALSDSAACDPATNAGAFCRRMNANLSAIRLAAPNASEFDVWCYLAWSHNAGLGDALRSIANYGLDWDAAKSRPQNDWFLDRLIPYAEHIATRATDYPDRGTSSDTGALRSVLFVGALALVLHFFTDSYTGGVVG